MKKPNAVRPLIQRLEALKLKRGQLAALARAVRVKPNVVTNWANGTNIPSWEYIEAIAKFLGLSVPELLTPLEDGAGRPPVTTAIPSEASAVQGVSDGATTARLLQSRRWALRLLTNTARQALALGATHDHLAAALEPVFPDRRADGADGRLGGGLADVPDAQEKKRH